MQYLLCVSAKLMPRIHPQLSASGIFLLLKILFFPLNRHADVQSSCSVECISKTFSSLVITWRGQSWWGFSRCFYMKPFNAANNEDNSLFRIHTPQGDTSQCVWQMDVCQGFWISCSVHQSSSHGKIFHLIASIVWLFMIPDVFILSFLTRGLFNKMKFVDPTRYSQKQMD